ncbi:MAG: hypothetical protein GY928_15400 [Colwellia sp.]|nr:hypothetical protein [Colwellia sp.]
MVCIGIDNGITGAVAILNKNGLALHPMSIYSDGKRNRVCALSLRTLLTPYEGTGAVVVYEKVAGSQNARAAVSMADFFARVDVVLSFGRPLRR